MSDPKLLLSKKKVSFASLPMNVISEVAVGMTEGAMKYGAYNFRETPIKYSTYFDSTLRHLLTWWEGQDMDPDSGLNHITKAITSLIVLRDGMMHDGKDDRPPKTEFIDFVNIKHNELLTRLNKSSDP